LILTSEKLSQMEHHLASAKKEIAQFSKLCGIQHAA
jgi:hypothetical protein